MDQIISLLVKAGAVLLAVVAVLAGSYEVFSRNNGSTAAGEQSQLATNIETYYNGGMMARNYSSISNSSAIRAALVPKSMLNGDGNTIAGPWGGSTVTISTWGNGFQVAWSNVDGDSCATFARSQAPQNVNINGDDIPLSNSDAATQIANACNASSGASTASVIFEYAG
ncbi:hypothetical protein HLH44_19060 [Gluconacetobacter sp. 1c LMG 22058]|uniref:Type 4 secretion system PilS N-terminal domain-containing protein n=1 Tax=Gluconacetobacter dulcium TaxID=2729096 RepID=A0A7W4PIP7_9PROT|nr:type 4 pilus major pilin [Gluconacetobacter dulcium]MBB2199507.1 hypothetical protein [Gluconacetobacter dulcium]